MRTLNTTIWTIALALSGIVQFVLSHAAGSKPEARGEVPFARAAQGKALFEEKCKTVAGEKVYRTAPDVEGVLLLKVRPQASEKEWRDPMWAGAAFAHESAGGETGYIQTFLKYEAYVEAGGKKFAKKIGLTTNPTDLPGYRYVDVIDAQDGKRYRYTGSMKEVTRKANILIGGDGKPFTSLAYVLAKTPTSDSAPRYGVTFEDSVIPEERVVGIASSTVKVIDLKTQEVLGEMTRYAWSPGGPSGANPSPWLAARKCGGHSDFQATRFFVDQILIPRKEK